MVMELTPVAGADELRLYLGELVAGGRPGLRAAGRVASPYEIFELLTARRFSHLSRGAAQRYRERTITLLERSLAAGGPVPFWFDIGPGYHASLKPGDLPLTFNVGLAELMILHQVSAFHELFSELHHGGCRFTLVVDNLCALWTNDIPTVLTEGYTTQLRRLIAQQGLEDVVDVLVESEEFDVEEYERLFAETSAGILDGPISESDLENVERFLGRPCDLVEAKERIARYLRAGCVTELLLERVVRGVRMTQRAGATTLGFRSFPGGDSRAQCGQVVITRNGGGKLKPLLLTSRNIDDYDCSDYEFPDLLPSQIEHVTYAERR